MGKHNAPKTPMQPAASQRIARATAIQHGGQIPPGSFATRVDREVQRASQRTTKKK